VRKLAILVLLLLHLSSEGQVESGVPIIKNYTPEDYEAPAQNLCVTQDQRGVLYFGNSGGLIEYDGVFWRTIVTDIFPEVQSVAEIQGHIYVGSRDDFGLLKADSLGNSYFHSILTNSGDSSSEFGAVHRIHYVEDSAHIVFQAEFAIFFYNGKTLRKIEFEKRLVESFNHKGILYLSTEEGGLYQYFEGRILPCPGAELLKDAVVREMFPSDKEHLLLLTSHSGLFELHLNKAGFPLSLKPFPTKLDALLKNMEVQGAISIREELVSISTVSQGLILIKNWSDIVQIVDRESGLQSEIIEGQFLDDQSNLWLALDNGLSKIELDYPITSFSELNGIYGNVESLVRFDERLFAATSAGIYVLGEKKQDALSSSKAKFIEYFPEQCWSLGNFENEGEQLLLAAFNNEVGSFDETGKLQSIYECYPWMIQQSRTEKDIVFIGLDPGLAIARRENGHWKVLADLAEVGESINSLNEEDDGTLWLGTRSFGSYRLQGVEYLKDTIQIESIDYFYTENGLPEGEVFLSGMKDKSVFGTNNSLYIFSDSNNYFGPYLSKGFPDSAYVHRISFDEDQNLWAVTYHHNQIEIGYVQKLDSNWVSETFNPISNEIINAFHFDEGGIVWLGGPKGIFRYDQSADHDHKKEFNTLLRKIYIQKGAEEIPVFEGTFSDSNGVFLSQQPKSAILDFEHDRNDFVFEFAAQSEANVKRQKYSYKLEGYHSDWRPWKSETKAVYTNLPPKEYTFMVKSLNIFNHESKIATYKFTINPPWWQTGWYYFGQTLFFLILILLTFFLNRGGGGTKFAEIVAFVTIITVFEFVIMLIEPFFNKYTGGVPVFQLAMNILMAMSLVPIELWLKKYLRRNKEQTEVSK